MERITRFRAAVLLIIFGLLLGFFAVRMYSMQVLGRTENVVDNASTYTSDIRVRAARGDILDNNGNKLIGNRASYNMVFNNYVLMSSDEPNESLQKLVSLCRKLEIEYEDHFPVTLERPYEYTLSEMDNTWQGYFQAYLTKKDIDSDISANRLMKELRGRYKIPDNWSDSDARRVIGLRFELELRGGITNLPSYEFIVDVDSEDMTAILELNTPGLTAEASTVREYYTENAAHVLGSVGPMNGKQWEKYKELDYEMDAYVGQTGLEAAFEEELHGTDGLLRRTVDRNGNIISEYWVTEPVAGNNVEISIDIDMQVTAENALEAFVLNLRNGNGLDGEGVGADIQGGAAVAIEVKTGKILACATYPSYTLSEYRDNYTELLQEEYNPLINRALELSYPPGSTFKVCMAVAAMESGAISADTTVQTLGKYTKYFGDSGPTCLAYSSRGGNHGVINVKQALAVSCNYFFYEMADRIQIDTMDYYAKMLGLGEPTGVELYETIGHRANEETKIKLYGEDYGDWYVGDTILAGIGQSEHSYTPLQLAVYTATVANGGTRLAATFLNRVVSPDYSTLVYERTPKIMSQLEISSATLQAVKEGMNMVTTTGSASRFFFYEWDNPYNLQVCGKTGTAEHGSGGSNNGAFICFAPMDDPQIAIAIYGEKAGAGGNLSLVAQQILDAYFAGQSGAIAASDAPVYENRVG